MINKFDQFGKTFTILFIMLWGIILSGCQSIGPEKKLNQENENIATPAYTLMPQQPTPLSTLVSPTIISGPDLTTSEVDDQIENDITPTLMIVQLSSPLEGIPLEELSQIVSNPFDYAGDGKDEGHHGTDYSFYQYKTYKSIENLPVLSITSGKVRSVLNNRPPYGNTILIETPFSALPVFFADYLQVQYPVSDVPYYTNLSCPEFQLIENSKDSTSRSLYVLYGHLFSPPAVKIDSLIFGGEKIGEVGNSGYSGNPHLHLEFRIGPSGYRFEEMAHYDNTASQEEIYNYCLWRVSGLFYQIDPMATIEFYLQNR